MMTPAGALMIEHRLIERMFALGQRELERLRVEHSYDTGFLAALVEFHESYTETCHHGKEEDILFAALDEKAVDAPLRQLLQELRDEHVRMHDLTRQLREADQAYHRGAEGALAAVGRILEERTTLGPQHIAKEDKRFFLPAQGYFSKQELAGMLERFREFDQQLLHQHYREVVGQWEEARHPSQAL